MSVSAHTIKIVKSTVPLLETGGVALTSHFYNLLFTEAPVAKDIFNMSNQEKSLQPVALANSVLCFARHIDALENMSDQVERIVQKHVAFQIKDPALYDLVGSLLLRSIREVLGKDVATDEVMTAWTEAYGMLAQILIKLERDAFKELENAPGGWADERMFVVTKKDRESDDVISFYLTPKDGKEVLVPLPGQYMTVRAKLGDRIVTRQYSVSDVCDGKSYRITVKKINGGAMSTYLHDVIKEGDEIIGFTPCGAFKLADSQKKPVTAIAGGIGITPMISIMKKAKESGADSNLLHFTNSPLTEVLKTDFQLLREAGINVKVIHTQGKYNKNSELLHNDLKGLDGHDVYCVGPTEFMRAVHKYFNTNKVQNNPKYEFFCPTQPLEN